MGVSKTIKQNFIWNNDDNNNNDDDDKAQKQGLAG